MRYKSNEFQNENTFTNHGFDAINDEIKLLHIENTNLDDPDCGMDDLTFSEEVHNKASGVNIIDLKPQGRHIRVTEEVKLEYLDLLAQFRLSECIKDNLTYFLEGLHTFVPDTLL